MPHSCAHDFARPLNPNVAPDNWSCVVLDKNRRNRVALPHTQYRLNALRVADLLGRPNVPNRRADPNNVRFSFLGKSRAQNLFTHLVRVRVNPCAPGANPTN